MIKGRTAFIGATAFAVGVAAGSMSTSYLATDLTELVGIPPSKPTYVGSSRAVMVGEPCAVASDEKVQKLIKRLFPNAEIIESSALTPEDIKSGCVLEVDMLADSAKPETRGFVYVLPDGERMLNGPLMDKRSKVDLQSGMGEEVRRALELQQATVKQALANVQQASGAGITPAEPMAPQAVPTSPGQPVISPAAPAPEAVADASTARKAFFETMQALPALQTQNGTRNVYVMFDPQCPHCRDLYKQHEAVAQKHDIQFHWIPMFLNDRSWAMSAFLLKTAQSSPQKGQALLDAMLSKTWNPQDDAEAVLQLTEDDYAYAKQAALAFYEASKDSPVLGTPLVSFQMPNGEIELISGVPRPDDWLVLAE